MTECAETVPSESNATVPPRLFALTGLRSAAHLLATGLLAPVLACFAGQPQLPVAALALRDGWAIQSSADVRDGGQAISTPNYNARNWYRTSVPSTVFSALVHNRVYPDPFFGMNLRTVAGTSYPIGANFSNITMPPDSPFRHSWWYRTDFEVPAAYRGKTIWLNFDGINYRANVWINGRQLASADRMAGTWRLFQFDVTRLVESGQKNALAVEVFPPQVDDLAMTFVDWNPMPPDKEMGLWRGVRVSATGPVALRFPQVTTKLNLPETNAATLTVTAELHNAAARPVEGVLKGRIENVEFSQSVRLNAHETRVVSFAPEALPQLRFTNPRLWWPVNVGPQNLYPLEIQFETEGNVSDQAAMRFGIREITSHLDAQNHRVFQVNGKNILIRGTHHTFEMLLRVSPARQEAELTYARDMNLNAIRLEGKIEDEHFLDLCDRMGIMVFAGWCCCEHWEHWADWKPEDYTVAAESTKDQIRRLRSHPSLANWMNGSDLPPVPEVEQMYLDILKEYNWPNPVESGCDTRESKITGATGVKMTGPYTWVPPSYWLLDKTRGGAHGFNTETDGVGPAVPHVESLRRIFPEEHLWPINFTAWYYHTSGMDLNMKVFTEALNRRYGTATSLEDYVQKAQVMAYDGQRAMFEAFGRNKYTATGVIQWMLNSAWPSIDWQLFDYFLRPGGSYFGTKKGNEPLHVQYSYDDGSIVVVNSYYEAYPGMNVTAQVYNLDMTEKFSKEARLDVGPDSSNRVFTIPQVSGLSKTYFLRLGLQDSTGKPVSSNLYWLSTQPDALDLDAGPRFPHHPLTTTFADLSGLATLPKVDLNVRSASENGRTRVTVDNPSRNLAFFIRLKVSHPRTREEIVPVIWEDNYFSLFPGEKRTVTASYRASDFGKGEPIVEVSGWNVYRK